MLIKEVESFIEEDLGYDDVSCTIVPDRPSEPLLSQKRPALLPGIKEAKSIFAILGFRLKPLLKMETISKKVRSFSG